MAAAYVLRGGCYADTGDPQSAVTDFTEALRLDAGLAKAYLGRGDCYADRKQYERAIADYTQAILLEPTSVQALDRPAGLRREGGAREAPWTSTRRSGSIRKYKQVYRNRAWSYDRLKEYDKAVADYTEAIRLDPKYRQAYTNRGVAYAKSGDDPKAIADFTEAIALSPNEPMNELNRRGLTGR